MKRLASISLAVMLFSNTQLFSKEVQPAKVRKINLKQVFQLAQKNDTILQKLQFNNKVFNAQYDEAKQDFLPKLSTELTRSHAVTFSNPRGTTIFTSDNSVELPIYDRAIIYNKRKAKSELRLNHLRLEKRLNDLSKEIITLYYSVLNYKSIVQIRKEEYVKAKDFYNLTKKKLKHKRVLPLDLLLSKGLLLQSKNQLISARYDYSEEKLKLIHRLNFKNDIELNDEIERGNGYSFENKPLEQNIKLGFSQRGDIKEKYYESKVQHELYEIEQSIFYPKVSLFSDMQLTGEDNLTFKDRTDWSVFVTVSLSLMDDVTLSTSGGYQKDFRIDDPKDEESIKLSIFDGTSNRVKREQAKSNYKSIQNELRDLKLKIRRDIITTYHDIQEAKNTIQLAKINKKIGSGLVRKADAEYRIGKKGLEDVIEAKEKEIRYKIEYQQAILKYRLALLNLKWAIGILWKDFY